MWDRAPAESAIHADRANRSARIQNRPADAMNQRWRPAWLPGTPEFGSRGDEGAGAGSSASTHWAAHQASISERNANTTLRLLRFKRRTGKPLSRSQRCTVRTPRLTYAAISFQESRRSATGSIAACAAWEESWSGAGRFIFSPGTLTVFARTKSVSRPADVLDWTLGPPDGF